MRHHDILGIPANATPEEIQKAYRRKVFESHPDRNIGDSDAPKRFMEIQEAYDALTNQNYKPSRPTPAPPKPKTWWDAPPPTHDIWGNPLDGSPRPQKKPKPRPRPVQVKQYIPEVDLWKSMETKEDKFVRSYWKEYNRLKNEMAYEEPEKFWAALEEWKAKNK